MAQQLARLPVYEMNLRAGWANDNLVLINQRPHLVELVEHAIDALARYRTSEGDIIIAANRHEAVALSQFR